MRIITWNCNMAFRKKWHHLTAYDPDILVIQECENPDKYNERQKIPNVKDFLWFGDNPNKGVAIISFGSFSLSVSADYNEQHRYIIPVSVSGDLDFKLWAIWAMPVKNNKRDSYVGQVWNALNHYSSLSKKRTVLIGDFNSNAIWDFEKKPVNHSLLVQYLKKHDIVSLYHRQFGEPHGAESKPTFFLVKNKDKPYHLDYCFSSIDMIHDHTSITVGKYEDWISVSDHVPLMIDF